MSLLRVEEITKVYGGLRALDHFSLNVEKGIIKGLIGPNGAGKSTLFHLISGIESPTQEKYTLKIRRSLPLNRTKYRPLELQGHFRRSKPE